MNVESSLSANVKSQAAKIEADFIEFESKRVNGYVALRNWFPIIRLNIYVFFQLAILCANDHNRMKEVNDMYAKVLVRSLVT